MISLFKGGYCRSDWITSRSHSWRLMQSLVQENHAPKRKQERVVLTWAHICGTVK